MSTAPNQGRASRCCRRSCPRAAARVKEGQGGHKGGDQGKQRPVVWGILRARGTGRTRVPIACSTRASRQRSIPSLDTTRTGRRWRMRRRLHWVEQSVRRAGTRRGAEPTLSRSYRKRRALSGARREKRTSTVGVPAPVLSEIPTGTGTGTGNKTGNSQEYV